MHSRIHANLFEKAMAKNKPSQKKPAQKKTQATKTPRKKTPRKKTVRTKTVRTKTPQENARGSCLSRSAGPADTGATSCATV